MLISGRSGSGKALDVEAPIPTPDGWTKMGDLRVGDEVYDDSGHPCRVTAVFDQPPGRPCFEVVFSDGSTIVADAEHRWLTHNYSARKAARYRAMTTNLDFRCVYSTLFSRGAVDQAGGKL